MRPDTFNYRELRDEYHWALRELGSLCETDERMAQYPREVYVLRSRIRRVRARMYGEFDAGTQSAMSCLTEMLFPKDEQ